MMKVFSLTADFQMRFRNGVSCFAPPLAALDAAAKSALFPAKRFLAFSVRLGISNRISVAVRKEHFQPHVKADFLTSDRKRNVYGFTDNESVPMTISPKDKMSRLWRSFQWSVHLDFEALANLCRNAKPVAFQPRILTFSKLPQLNAVPMQGILEAWLKFVFFALGNGTVCQHLLGFVSLPSLVKSIGKHLNSRLRNVLTTTPLKSHVQVVPIVRFPCVIVAGACYLHHFVVKMASLTQTVHQKLLLRLVRKYPIFIRSHSS